MALQAVTVNLPDPLYQRLALRAGRAQRTVEAEIVEAVHSSCPDEQGELPTDLAESLAALNLLSDTDLWRAAKQHLEEEKSALIEELHWKRQREGLSVSESEALTMYMREYTRTMLVRSRAAALLKERGQDVAGLLTEDEP
ncbi:MAG TPA: hypothetical protein PK156_24380 [Polyangium sp.]|nr:hypothetical protein [Polyangium sp.]